MIQITRIRGTGAVWDRRNSFQLSLGLLLWMFLSCDAVAQSPIITEDPKHPGYYKPFRCLSIDRSVRGHWGAIRNNCGFGVEASWQSATAGSGSMVTIPAGGLYSLFEETDPNVLGCLPNDGLNRSLQLCRGGNLKLRSEADKLAKELGIPARSSGNPTNQRSDADALARELGIAAPSSPRSQYTATQLENDLAAWEEREQLRKREEQRQRQMREERERVAAIERAKREEDRRRQQQIDAREARNRQMEEDERQAAQREPEQTRGPGLFDLLVQGADTLRTIEGARSRSESSSSSQMTPASGPSKGLCDSRYRSPEVGPQHCNDGQYSPSGPQRTTK